MTAAIAWGAFRNRSTVDTVSKNYLTIALEEVASGKVAYRYR